MKIISSIEKTLCKYCKKTIEQSKYRTFHIECSKQMSLSYISVKNVRYYIKDINFLDVDFYFTMKELITTQFHAHAILRDLQ